MNRSQNALVFVDQTKFNGFLFQFLILFLLINVKHFACKITKLFVFFYVVLFY